MTHSRDAASGLPGGPGRGRSLGASDPPGWWIPACAAIFVLLYVVWYPRTFAIIDESSYLSTAYVYRAGTIYSDAAGISCVSRVSTGDHQVSKFAPLMSLLLLPFTWAGWRAAFATNLLLHLLGFWAFARLIREERIPGWTSLLYLFHPTLVLYSRTLMSDVAAGVFFLLAYLHSRREGDRASFLAGTWAGVSCLVRYSNLVLVGLFVGAVAWKELRDGCGWRASRARGILAGLVLPGTLLLGYNRVAFGTWWRGTSGYWGDTGLIPQFSAGELLPNLAHYVPGLLLVYPAMLAALFWYRGRDRFVLRSVALGFSLFFCFYYYHDRGATPVETFVRGLRFLIPVLPLYFVAYAQALARVAAAMGVSPRRATVALSVAGLLGVSLVHVRHDAFLRAQDARRRALYDATTEQSVIACNTAARELIHDVWGRRQPFRCEFQGNWILPPLSHAGEVPVFVAVAGRNPESRLPESIREFLERSGAILVSYPERDPGLRVWRIPPPDAAGRAP